MKIPNIFIFLCFLIPGPALALDIDWIKDPSCTQHAYMSIVADTLSTEYALDQPNTYEVNPIYGSDPSDTVLFAAGVARIGLAYLLDQHPTGRKVNCYLSALSYAAAANNIAVGMDEQDARLPAAGIAITIPFWW